MSTYEISKSSLLSLKAEILRKQSEVQKTKYANEVRTKRLKLKQNITTPEQQKRPQTSSGDTSLTENDDNNEEMSDVNLVRKSQQILEAKARLYDKLAAGTSNLTPDEEEYNKRCLVRFSGRYSNGITDDNETDQTIEYTDHFGRTITCSEKDLKRLQSQDRDLEEFVGPRVPAAPSNDNESNEYNDSSELLSGDMRRELMRRQWEDDEEKLRQKTNIHYQDVLYDEARSHGVGYFAFSTDEEERMRQQAALRKLREETKLKQARADQLKTERERQMALRLLAAQNRKRARSGLPPLDTLDDVSDGKNMTADNVVTDDGDTRQVTDEEKCRAQARKDHIRPWDICKLANREHYEYSQEEWVDKKRQDRYSEFAPPQDYRYKKRPIRDEEEGDSITEGLKFIRRQIEGDS